MRATLHYLFALVVLVIYGGQVCPMVESLDLPTWTIILSITVALLYVIRFSLIKYALPQDPYHLQTQRQMLIELLIFSLDGIAVGVYNYMVYNFPFESGIKIFIGFTIFSFFIAVDLALAREREVTAALRQEHAEVFISARYLSLTHKFAAVAIVSAVGIITVLFLVFSKDLDWLLQGHPLDLWAVKRSILAEIGFVVLTLLVLLINLILSFTQNLQMFFKNENSVMQAVADGDYDVSVPVSTTDEFGVMAQFTNQMIFSLKERTRQLIRTQDVTIYSLAALAETRDPETGGHILRTQRYVRALAECMRQNPKFHPYLNDEIIDLYFKSAPLHDIGKVGIPDNILLKPGPLTDKEFDIMKLHTVYGHDAIMKSEKLLGPHSFLTTASEIAYAHQEKWDGSG